MDQIKAIAKAAYNKISNNDELDYIKQERLKVCKSCPLFSKGAGRSYCNGSKSINKTTGAVIDTPNKEYNPQEYQRGCGCTLESTTLPEKTTVIGFNNTCPARKWDKVEQYMFMGDITIQEQSRFNDNPTVFISSHNKKVTIRKLTEQDLIDLKFQIVGNRQYQLKLKINLTEDLTLDLHTDYDCTRLYVNKDLLSDTNLTKEELNQVITTIKTNIKNENSN